MGDVGSIDFFYFPVVRSVVTQSLMSALIRFVVAAQTSKQPRTCQAQTMSSPSAMGSRGAGVAHFDAGQTVVVFDGIFDAIDHIKGSPFRGLVDQDQTAGREVGR